MSHRNVTAGWHKAQLFKSLLNPTSRNLDSPGLVHCTDRLGGWRYTAKAGCYQSASGGLTTMSIKLTVAANKTGCFNAFEAHPKTVHLDGFYTTRATRPAVRTAVHVAHGQKAKAPANFCSAAGLRKAGFPDRIAHRGYTSIDVASKAQTWSLIDPATRAFRR